MRKAIARRDWLKQASIAAIGLGFSSSAMAGEDYLPKKFGSEKGLLNLSANENPYGVSAKTRQAVIDAIADANRYFMNVPAIQVLKKEIAGYHSVSPDHVLLTAGSGQALMFLGRQYGTGNIVSPDVTFGILPTTIRRAGAEVIEVPLTHDKVHDLPAMLKAINSNTQLAYICNPANPTGTIVKPAALQNFCEEASKKTTVLVDEAYIDFLDAPDNVSMISLVEKNPRIIVTRTFSKIYGMAGLRVGYVLAHPSVIKQLDAGFFQNTQFNISGVSQAAALVSLHDEAHKAMTKQNNAAARAYTYNELTRLTFHCIPSYTNFLFFKLENYPGDFAADMLRKNVLLRSSVYPDGKWARVSIGTMQEMQQFIAIMKTMFKS